MALNQKCLRILGEHLRNAKILSLGYPDLLVKPEGIKKILNVDIEEKVNRGFWHTGKHHGLPETQELIQKLGSTLDCVDVVKDFGIEKVVDLNHPHDLGQYDLVIDPGTIEHCFNIGQAIINAANAVKVGGRIFHVPPMTMLNHGFYNICPTLLHDFYTQNGWHIEFMAVFGREGLVQFHQTERFGADSEASLYFLAKRTNDKQLKFPIQSKYMRKMEKSDARRAA